MVTAVKIALRGLRRTPAFTILALAILSLGIGATTAMFTVTRTILFKPLAYRDPARLTTLMLRIPAFEKVATKIPLNARHYEFWTQHNRSFEQIALINPQSAILSGAGESISLHGVRVTPNLFDVLGIQPRLGRGFLPHQSEQANRHVAVISDSLWRQKFNADPNVLGRKILLDEQPYQIVGVTAPTFPFPRGRQLADIEPLPEHTDYWIPAAFTKEERADAGSYMNFLGLGRLKPGVSLQQASSDLDSLESVIAKDFPQPIEVHALVQPLQSSLASAVRQPLFVLLGAVVLVLVVACINLMNLMLVRAIGRRREWAIRLAVGANVRQLMREGFLESLLLSLAGGALGSLTAVWLLALVRSRAPFDLPRIDEIQLDPVALLFALGASLFSALLFGLLPAWRAARIDPQESLQSSGRSATEDRKGHFLGQALVAAEVTLSVVLLLGAGLLIRSFMRILQVDPGVQVQHLVFADIQLPPVKYKEQKPIREFYHRVLDSARALPGVERVGLVSQPPLTVSSSNQPMTAADRPIPPLATWPMTASVWSSGDYFTAAGVPLKQGRAFAPTDGGNRVVVISENLADRLWHGQSAVGHLLKGFSADGKDQPWRVVGVAGDVHAASLTAQAENMVYFPYWQSDNRGMSLVIRTAGDPRSIAGAIRRSISDLDSDVPVSRIRLMDDILSDSVAQRRFQLVLLIGFAAVGLILACLGIYGVLAFTVTRRTSEIGIRMALGAQPGQVRRAMLRRGMLPVVVGLAVGLLISVAAGSVLQSLLFDVKTLDPLTYFVTSGALLAVASLACLIPSQRAARLNSVDALHRE